MTSQQPNPQSKPQTMERADVISFGGLMVVLVLTYAWFFAQVAAYVN